MSASAEPFSVTRVARRVQQMLPMMTAEWRKAEITSFVRWMLRDGGSVHWIRLVDSIPSVVPNASKEELAAVLTDLRAEFSPTGWYKLPAPTAAERVAELEKTLRAYLLSTGWEKTEHFGREGWKKTELDFVGTMNEAQERQRFVDHVTAGNAARKSVA